MSGNKATSRSQGAYQIIQAYSDVLAPLLDAEGPTRVDQDYQGALQRLHHHGIIESVARGETQDFHYWQIAPLYRDMVRSIMAEQPHLPCGVGHTGWRTVEAGVEYACTTCGERYSRAEIEQFEAQR